MKRLAVMVVLAFGAPYLSAHSAHAEECQGDSDLRGRQVQCEREAGPVPGVEVGGSSESRLPAGWSVDVRYTFGIGLYPGATPEGPFPCDPNTGGELSRDGLPAAPAAWPGRFGLLSVRDGTGATVAAEITCFGERTALPAWFPPSRAQIERALAEAPWPASTTGLDPYVDGLTGLETRVWSTTLPAQPISVGVGNSTVVGTAVPVLYRWHMGDGTSVTAAHPGSAQSPAATHVYETKGDYEVVLEIEWQADVEVVTQLPGGGVLRFRQDPPLAPVTIAGSRDYPVVEVRSILVPNEN